MIGMSYGGFYTLYTTALEPRIKAAVVAGYFNDREAILDDSEPYGLFDWRFPDSLGWLRDPNIAALVCPRPLLVEDGEYDQIFPDCRGPAGRAAGGGVLPAAEGGGPVPVPGIYRAARFRRQGRVGFSGPVAVVPACLTGHQRHGTGGFPSECGRKYICNYFFDRV